MDTEKIPTREEIKNMEQTRPETGIARSKGLQREGVFAIAAIIVCSMLAIAISPLLALVLCILGLGVVGSLALKEQSGTGAQR